MPSAAAVVNPDPPTGLRLADRVGLRDLLPRLVRYAGVSAVSTGVSLAVLAVLVATSLVRPGPANVIATAAGTIPSFELNRRWVWGGGGRPRLIGQMVPFVALSFLGLGLSTIAVTTATGWAERAGWHGAGMTAAALTANLVTFGSLWAAQYVILDRLLFRRPQAGSAALAQDRAAT